MKKIIIGILGICLLIGIPFIIMDLIASEKGPFNIPSGYEKIKVSLNEKARNNEIVYSKELKAAAEINIMIQSDSDLPGTVRVSSDKKLIGYDTKEESYEVMDLTGNTEFCR